MADAQRFEKLLLVSAVAGEVGAALERAGVRAIVEDWSQPGWPIVEISSHAMVTITGIGRANAAGATAAALATRAFDAVINLGVAGALATDLLAIGDVVLANESVFFEEGIHLENGHADVDALGFPLGEWPWAQGNRIRTDPELNEWFRVRLSSADHETLHVRTGPIATVAGCSGTDHAAREVLNRTHAIAEAMEGAAVIATARRLGIPATELRVISNTCGDRAQQQWDLKRAFHTIDRVLRMIIQ